ncbi:MAG: dihydrofolate reductase [Acinetobacter sp.]
MSFQGLEVVHVVAMDQQQCIGKNNDLPWHIPADLKHFKEITQGGVVVMGRKTLESMGRTLPKRVNWVITRDTDWSFEGTKVANSIEDALHHALNDVANSEKPNSIFIIGGGEIFKQTLSIADRLELTHVHLNVQGDTYYPAIPATFHKVKSSMHTDETSGIQFEFATYQPLAKNIVN